MSQQLSSTRTRTIDNGANTVDSRDIVARITLLQSYHDAAVETAAEYRARIAEVDRLRPSDASPSIWAQNDHAIETLEDELAHLRSSIWQYDGEGPEFAPDDDPLWSEEEAAELTTLKEVAREGERISRDWTRGATLIRETHFEDYARQLVDDLSFSNRPGAWPYNHIDWEAAADELKQDYSTIVWDGVDYLIRD